MTPQEVFEYIRDNLILTVSAEPGMRHRSVKVNINLSLYDPAQTEHKLCSESFTVADTED